MIRVDRKILPNNKKFKRTSLITCMIVIKTLHSHVKQRDAQRRAYIFKLIYHPDNRLTCGHSIKTLIADQPQNDI
jgi:hypothetical protein